ncbi:MAG: alpha/beta hydrolase [Acidimicrobiia bacterium]
MADRPAAYDEFGLFHENAAEWGLAYAGPPVVRREDVTTTASDGGTGGDLRLSALVWGTSAPELVLIHGGGQNAHTWDTVALALGRSLIAVDLPGHGHSGPLPDAPFAPTEFAARVEQVVAVLAPSARVVVGMSLGGLTSIALAARAPQLVRRLALVDVLPTIDPQKAAPIAEFINGPESFATFDEILERTIAFNPTRSESSLRRGVLHNSVQRDDGTWVWRHQQHWDIPGTDSSPAHTAPTTRDAVAARAGETEADVVAASMSPYDSFWDDLGEYPGPIMLVRGLAKGTIIDDSAVAELVHRRPDARVEAVEGAGHSVQGDQPLVLAALLDDFADS